MSKKKATIYFCSGKGAQAGRTYPSPIESEQTAGDRFDGDCGLSNTNVATFVKVKVHVCIRN
jgi:hypothetical protein